MKLSVKINNNDNKDGTNDNKSVMMTNENEDNCVIKIGKNIWNQLLTANVGSKSHTTEFSTIYRAIITLSLLSVPGCLLMISPFLTLLSISNYSYSIEWNIINVAVYIWSWSIWIVLVSVMMKLDYTRMGTFFELFHNCAECFVVFVCFDRTIYGIFACTASFIFQVIPTLRTQIENQYAIAIILGTLSHYINIFPLIYFASQNDDDNKLVWLIPISMIVHFTYDSIYAISRFCFKNNCCDQNLYKTQFFLVFCNISAIIIQIIFIYIHVIIN